MTLLARVFTTKTLLQIIFVLTATVMMKAISAHYDFQLGDGSRRWIKFSAEEFRVSLHRRRP